MGVGDYAVTLNELQISALTYRRHRISNTVIPDSTPPSPSTTLTFYKMMQTINQVLILVLHTCLDLESINFNILLLTHPQPCAPAVHSIVVPQRTLPASLHAGQR